MSINDNISLSYPAGTAYDHCSISSFFKKLFAKCCEKESSPDLTITTTITDVQNDVTALNKEDVTELSYEYLHAMETSLKDVAFRYAVIHKDDKPILFAYFQLYALSTQNFKLDGDNSFMQRIVGFFLKFKKAKVLILGNALRTDTAAFSYDARAMSADEAIASVATIADKLATDTNATAVILKDIGSNTQQANKMLADMGYKMPWPDQVMDLAIQPEWNTLNDYVSTLSRKYKTRANKVLASGKDIAVRALTADEITKYVPAIKHLFAGLIEKQSFTLTKRGVHNIAELKQLYKDAFEVVGYFKDDKLIAFYSAFVKEDAYELYYVGFDYARNNEYQLYFNILFSGLERAILLKKKTLNLGRTSFDAKASMGAIPKNADYLIRLIHIPDVAVKWFSKYFSSLEDVKWKLRRPFKTAEQPA